MADIRIKDGTGTLRTIMRAQVKDSGGTVRLLQRIRVMVGGTLQTVFTYLSAVLNRDLVTGAYNGASTSPQNITTSAVAVTVTGGTPAYTYLWSAVGTPSYVWTINNGTTANASFTAAAVPLGADDSNAFHCSVTDSTGASVFSGVVVATVANNSTA